MGKSVGPAKRVQFLGLIIDSVLQRIEQTQTFTDGILKLKRPNNHTRVTGILRNKLMCWKIFASTVNGVCDGTRMVRIYRGYRWLIGGLQRGINFIVSGWCLEHLDMLPAGFSKHVARLPPLQTFIVANINLLKVVVAGGTLIIWLQSITLFWLHTSGLVPSQKHNQNVEALQWLEFVSKASLKDGFCFTALYSTRVLNVTADTLSRFW